jgi:hypothetical protein
LAAVTLQFAVSGATAGAALFFANVLLDKYRGPSLSIDKEHSVEPVNINLTLYRLDIEGFPQELSEYNIQYITTEINNYQKTWFVVSPFSSSCFSAS